MQHISIRTADLRDRDRFTVRIVPLRRFERLPVPGEPVQLRMPGTLRTIPGHVHFVHYGDETVGVEPDFQSLLAA